MEIPIFFDINRIFKDYITNHNEKRDVFLFNCDFKLFLNNFTPHIKAEFCHNTTFNNLKRYLLY